eukprot:TRINITY_DN2440_c0_g1_i1.p1 TRINITY_DN2440_c0_g1~~TRINITY_DN2440_c0_g1_i1.p1  ORF type:complete len:698 (+),score=154.35 TRINITY_DN2440_c0_g1_i1:310-2403(+)
MFDVGQRIKEAKNESLGYDVHISDRALKMMDFLIESFSGVIVELPLSVSAELDRFSIFGSTVTMMDDESSDLDINLKTNRTCSQLEAKNILEALKEKMLEKRRDEIEITGPFSLSIPCIQISCKNEDYKFDFTVNNFEGQIFSDYLRSLLKTSMKLFHMFKMILKWTHDENLPGSKNYGLSRGAWYILILKFLTKRGYLCHHCHNPRKKSNLAPRLDGLPTFIRIPDTMTAESLYISFRQFYAQPDEVFKTPIFIEKADIKMKSTLTPLKVPQKLVEQFRYSSKEQPIFIVTITGIHASRSLSPESSKLIIAAMKRDVPELSSSDVVVELSVATTSNPFFEQTAPVPHPWQKQKTVSTNLSDFVSEALDEMDVKEGSKKDKKIKKKSDKKKEEVRTKEKEQSEKASSEETPQIDQEDVCNELDDQATQNEVDNQESTEKSYDATKNEAKKTELKKAELETNNKIEAKERKRKTKQEDAPWYVAEKYPKGVYYKTEDEKLKNEMHEKKEKKEKKKKDKEKKGVEKKRKEVEKIAEVKRPADNTTPVAATASSIDNSLFSVAPVRRFNAGPPPPPAAVPQPQPPPRQLPVHSDPMHQVTQVLTQLQARIQALEAETLHLRTENTRLHLENAQLRTNSILNNPQAKQWSSPSYPPQTALSPPPGLGSKTRRMSATTQPAEQRTRQRTTSVSSLPPATPVV